jgi:restriction endonuclease S subunit
VCRYLGLNRQKAKRIWAHHAHGELKRACVSQGDVLITIKRRIAISTPILFEPGLMAVNQDVVVMTPKPGFRPGYIAAVLNSRVGQYQALRHATEQMNPYLNVGALGRLRIPVVSDQIQKKIEAIVIERLKLLDQSTGGYQAAEAELLKRLGWDELQNKQPELSYIKKSDELKAGDRIDAEFFQPQYVRLRSQLIQRGAQKLGEFCPKPSRGVQPSLVEDGEVVVVDSKAVRPQGIEPSSTERTTIDFYNLPSNAKGRIYSDDILFNSTGRGTIGRAVCYQLEGPALCDNHIAIIRTDQRICNPVYLALFLNSAAGFAQTEQFLTGSSGQLEIYPQHIQQFLVFIPVHKNGTIDLAWQEHLASGVKTAAAAKSAALAKLEEAKQLVEDAIG